MSRIEAGGATPSDYSASRSFAGTEGTPSARPRRIISPNNVDTVRTRHNKVRSINRPDSKSPTGSQVTETMRSTVVVADIPDTSDSTEQPRQEGKQPGAAAREGDRNTEQDIVPPIDPPTGNPAESAEAPEPTPPWERISELAQKPPIPEERGVVSELHATAVQRLLETHRRFKNTNYLPNGNVHEEVRLIVIDREASIEMSARSLQKHDGQRDFFVVNFPYAPDSEVASTTYSYVTDKSGTVRKHVLNNDSVEEKLRSISPGEVPHSAALEIYEEDYLKLGSSLELEREMGVTEEVGLEELQYVLNLAEQAIPGMSGAHQINDIHTRRLEGVPVGYEDAERGAREFTTHIHNTLIGYGFDPNAEEEEVGFEMTLDAQDGKKVMIEAGLYHDDMSPYTIIAHVNKESGQVVILRYHVVDEELITVRTVQKYVGGELLDEKQTEARGDVTEARYLRNFLHYPWTLFEEEYWEM